MKKQPTMVHKIFPSATDARIVNFNSQHFCYPPIGTPLNKLLLWLCATGNTPGKYQKYMTAAANAGFHVIGVMYPNEGDADCTLVSDGNYLDNFCWEVFTGEDLSPLVSVNAIDCINNRVFQLLNYLLVYFPSEGWNQYMNGEEILWDKVTAAGHSQGGFHSLIIGIHLPVEKVICLSAPNELCPDLVATFNGIEISKYRFFLHLQDDFANRDKVIRNMGVTEAYVDTYVTPQSGWSKYLVTSYPPGARQPHLMTALDNAVPVVGGVNKFQKVWEHGLLN